MEFGVALRSHGPLATSENLMHTLHRAEALPRVG